MSRRRGCIGIVALLFGVTAANMAFAQKAGGVLKLPHFDSPASMSILEEGSISAIMPIIGVFNNLVLFDQHVLQNREESIVPELATGWSWSEDGTELSFKLRQGVKWHDGKPFTAADVKCTYDLLTGKATEKLRLNYREAWFFNIDKVTTSGDSDVTFHLKQRQPALISLLASGYSPVYPCHVSAREMRSRPIGGGAEPGLLEAGAPLPRRHRIHHHRQSLHGDSRLRRRQIRYDLPVRSIDPAGKGRARPGPAGNLRS